MQNGKFKVKKAKRTGITLLALLLLLAVSIGGTLALLVTRTGNVKNTFTPGKVDCVVQESFDGVNKSNVTVKNTGNVDAYLRVKLISYRVNKSGQPIGGVTEIPTFTLGDGWFQSGDHYYYSKPVASLGTPPTPLIGAGGIALSDYHFTFFGGTSDGSANFTPYGIKSGALGGGYQVIEVVAEAIQADGVDTSGNHPVELAWGVKVADDGETIAPK